MAPRGEFPRRILYQRLPRSEGVQARPLPFRLAYNVDWILKVWSPFRRLMMPNIASIFKDEILRLARKEVRKEIEPLKKASAQYRSEIAALKRRLAVLEKGQVRQEKKASKVVAVDNEAEGNTRVRFSAKGFATKRQKLGISAGDMGKLLGVSGQTVYHWETGKSRPRQKQIAAIAAVRKLGKRKALAMLAS